MKKIGNLISMEQMTTCGLGNIHRGFKLEKEKRERILFYEIPHSLKIPEDFPQHIAVMDIIYKQQEKEYTLIGHSYLSGFPLFNIIQRCEKEAFPLPLDHSLLIIERISSAFSDFKLGFPHPLFIWLTYDGEIKCSPVPIPKIIQKVKDEEVLPYFSPQILQGDDWGRTEQVYCLGSLFFELLTGKKLPIAKNEDEVIQAVVKTPLLSEGTIPKDLQVILLKSLSFKTSERFQHIRDLREELGKLIYSGAYTPTTFNLAFFMHSLFREEIEKEEKKLKEEDAVDLTELLKPPKVEPPPTPPPVEIKREVPREEKKKSPFIFIGVSIVAILLIVFSIFLFKGQKPAPPPVQVQTKEDEELKKKLEEYEKKLKEVEAERQRQREELEKLQKEAQKNQEAKKELEKKIEEQKKTEEKLKEIEQKKKEMEATPQQKKEETPPQKQPEPPKKEEPAPPVKEEKPLEQAPKEEVKVIEEPKVETPLKEDLSKPVIKEGDLLDINEVDTAPVPLSEIKANFPPMAKLQKIPKAKVRLKILVNHKGEPEEIVVVSVSPPSNVGFDKEAMQAVKKIKFQPATKGGVKVKCWYWYTIAFGE